MTVEPNSYRRQKIIVLIGMTLYWLVSTLVNVLIPLSGTMVAIIFLVTSVGWGFGIFFWCAIDSKERGDELSGSEKIVIVVFGVLGLLLYLFHTRGGKGGFKAIGWMIIYMVSGYIAVTIVATIILVVLRLAGIQPIV